jgi:hypothetical protein
MRTVIFLAVVPVGTMKMKPRTCCPYRLYARDLLIFFLTRSWYLFNVQHRLDTQTDNPFNRARSQIPFPVYVVPFLRLCTFYTAQREEDEEAKDIVVAVLAVG